MIIIVATNNKGKIKEIKEILPKDIQLQSLEEMNIFVDVEEDGKTFEENAIKKATEIAKVANMPCIADDSGLCIDSVYGFPGVKTKRFMGEDASDRQRNNYLLELLKETKEKEKRVASAVTCIAYVDELGKEKVFRGEVKGYISTEPRGNNGFGFDEIFELENGKTLAELAPKEKNQISSRKEALNQLKEFLEKR